MCFFPVAILAGGLATRLRPVTERVPKSLVKVARRPFLQHQLEVLRKNGLNRVVLCVGYLGEMIEEEFGDGHRFGMKIDYSFDGDTLLGTGGAIRKALPQLGGTFYVLYGDSYLPIDFKAVGTAFTESRKRALMTVYRNDDKHDCSNVWFENGKIRAYDKERHFPQMRHIDFGLSVFAASAFERTHDDEVIDLAYVFRKLVELGDLAGFEVFDRFFEIGSPRGLAELDALLRKRP